MTAHKEVLIVGATGAVGSVLLKLCLDGDRYSRVSVIARRPSEVQHNKLNWIVSGFDALDELETISARYRQIVEHR